MKQHLTALSVVALTATLTACTIPTGREGSGQGATTAPMTTSVSQTAQTMTMGESPEQSSAQAAPDSDLQAGLKKAVEKVGAQYGGSLGVAIDDGTSKAQAGELTTGPAWSTIKVPIALAAAAKSTANPAQVTSALEASDNNAVAGLWSALGSPSQAAQETQDQIQALAKAPKVLSQKARPEFSAYGQTQWPLADQAEFGFQVQCAAHADAVTAHMGKVAADQRYGLGQLSGAHYKPGWGPNESGQYLVREFGYVPGPKGSVGVSIAAQASDGTYASGQQMLTALAKQVGALVDAHAGLGGKCRA